MSQGQGSLQFRANLGASNLRSIASWAARAYRNNAPFRALKPASVSQLGTIALQDPLDAEAELEWAVGLLECYADLLSKYVGLKSKLDSALSARDYRSAIALVDEINENICWSIHGLALKISLTTIFEGLESQKKWIEGIAAEGASPATRYFSYWFGIRAERTTSPDKFVADVMSRLQLQPISNDLRIFLLYELVDAHEGEDDFGALLLNVSQNSIVDLYEYCVRSCRRAATERWSISNLIYSRLLPFIVSMRDHRAIKISYLFGDLEFGEGVLNQGFSSPGEIKSATSVSALPSPEERLLAVKYHHFNKEKWIESHEGSTAEIIYDFDIVPSRFSQSVHALKKYNLTFPGTEFALWCSGVLSCIEGPSRLDGYLMRFTGSLGANPHLSNHLHAELRPNFTSRIKTLKGCEHSPYAAALCVQLEREGALEEYIHEQRWAEAVEVAQSLVAEFNVRTRLSVQAEIRGLINLGHISLALEAIVAIYWESDDCLAWVPWSELASMLSDDVVSDHAESTDVIIVTWLLAERFDESFRSATLYGLEEYLDSLGMDLPSMLASETIASSRDIKLILKRIATLDVLGMSMRFEGPESLEKERIAILQALCEADSEQKEIYETEIAEIVRSKEIADAIAYLNKSKISLDEHQIRDLAIEAYGSKFERLRAYVEAGLLPIDEEYRQRILEALESSEYRDDLFEVPENDAAALFVELLTDLAKEFSLNAKHGLNTYLSLRIRHGTIDGQLRRVFQEQNLLTMVEGPSDEYQENEFWRDQLSQRFDLTQTTAALKALAHFSQSFDKIVSRFADEIVQVRTPDKPAGLFDYAIPTPVIVGFAIDSQSTEEFEVFLEQFLEIYWINMRRVLQGVREYVRTDLMADIRHLLAELEAECKDALGGTLPPILNTSLTQARSGLTDAIEEMSEWFGVPQASHSAAMPLQDLTEIGKQMVVRLHPSFDPIVSVEDAERRRLSNALELFTDIFFVLFGNVRKHSGISNPRVCVSAEYSERMIELQFESECRDVCQHVKPIADALERIRNGKFEEAVSREGGTGFPKLAKLMSNSKIKNSIDAKVDTVKSTVTITLRFSYTNIANSNGGLGDATVTG